MILAQISDAAASILMNGAAIMFTVTMWLRIEHRITRLETKFEDFCNSKTKNP